jgi:oxygen-dependent protoporphyrinogen oxidase
MTDTPPRIVVLGGGIAGLSAAWECHRLGLAATVLERQERVGGVIRTDRVATADGEFILDAGPDAFLVSKTGARDLCRELGLTPQLIAMESPRGAYVLRDDALHALPEGGAFGVATRVMPFIRSTLLSPGGKLRVALEPVVPSRRAADDESTGAFFRRRFGREFATRVAQPLLGGIHAGDLDRLSALAVVPQLVAVERAGRSVLLNLRAQGRRAVEGGPFRSFQHGMSTLVDELVRRLPADTLRVGEDALDISRVDGAWRVQTARGLSVGADILLLAAPAPVVSRWLDPIATDAAALAAGVRYVSSAGILAAYRTADIARPLRGSGYVSTPQRGGERLLATSWLTGKWAGRAPAGFTILRGFYGGAHDEAVLAWTDEALEADARASWSRRFGIADAPVLSRVVRWHLGSPQHEVGHVERVRAIDAALRRVGGLGVAGSGFRAIGIPDVISDARGEMRRLLDEWRAR